MTDDYCVQECYYDHEQDLCTGCFRNLEELSSWFNLTKKEKENYKKIIRQREKEYFEKQKTNSKQSD